MLLIAILVVATFGLVPQSTDALGIELLVMGLVTCIGLTTMWARNRPDPTTTHHNSVVELMPSILGTLPYAIGGITLLAGSGGGLYWVLAGIVAATLGAVLNAWVLLVEILR